MAWNTSVMTHPIESNPSEVVRPCRKEAHQQSVSLIDMSPTGQKTPFCHSDIRNFSDELKPDLQPTGVNQPFPRRLGIVIGML